MGPAALTFFIGVIMILAGTRYRRTALGRLGIIIGGVLVFIVIIGVSMASITMAD